MLIRKRENNAVLQRILPGIRGTPGSAAVIGDPGFGKSRFLESWAERESRCTILGGKDLPLRLVDVRVPAGDVLGEEQFLGLLSAALRGEPPRSDAKGSYERETQAGFERDVKAIVVGSDSAVVFLVDDFHRLSKNPDLSMGFFSFLRHLGYTSRIGYLLTSRLDIADMTSTQDLQSSPFWNIFSKIRLQPLDRVQVEAVLEAEANQRWSPTPAQVEMVQSVSGGIPFLVFPAVQSVVAANGEGATLRGAKLIEALRQSCGGMLDEIWQGIDLRTREVVPALVSRPNSLTGAERDRALGLIQRGYVSDDDCRIRSLVIAQQWAAAAGVALDASYETDAVVEPARATGVLSRLFRRT